jgi:amino acid transporter
VAAIGPTRGFGSSCVNDLPAAASLRDLDNQLQEGHRLIPGEPSAPGTSRELSARCPTGLLPIRASFFGRIQPTFRTPSGALLFQGCLAGLLVLTGTFEEIYSLGIFSIWVFVALTAIALIALRTKEPALPRPYRAWGYPWTPLIVATVAFAMSANLWFVRPVSFLNRACCNSAWNTFFPPIAEESGRFSAARSCAFYRGIARILARVSRRHGFQPNICLCGHFADCARITG